MPSTPRAAGADDPDAFRSSNGRASATQWTDCAACQAPLPEGHRYVCAACAAESARRAEALLADLRARRDGTAEPEAVLDAVPEPAEPDDPLACPTCGMRLDDSGRCAGCVTTVRR
jgi:hypothetical protein